MHIYIHTSVVCNGVLIAYWSEAVQGATSKVKGQCQRLHWAAPPGRQGAPGGYIVNHAVAPLEGYYTVYLLLLVSFLGPVLLRHKNAFLNYIRFLNSSHVAIISGRTHHI